MPEALKDFTQAMPDIVVAAISLVMLAVFLMWVFLPFAIYGLKKKQNEQIEVLRQIQAQLKSGEDGPDPEDSGPREPKI